MCGSEGTILTSELWVGQGTRVRVKRGDKKRQSARFENLRNPPPKQKMSHGIPSESGGQALRTKQMLVILATLLAWLGLAHSFMMGLANGPPRAMINRREAVIAGSTIFASGVVRLSLQIVVVLMFFCPLFMNRYVYVIEADGLYITGQNHRRM